MDESNWKIVIELKRTGNITRAADRLFMSQPNLTKKLQAIESELGVRLVVRTPKGVSFTPEGEYVAREAADVLARFAEIRKNLLRIGDGRAGTIKLGMTNAFARYTLPSCLKRYKAICPEVEFDIVTDISGRIVERLHDDEIHVGFIRGDLEGDFERTLVSTDQAVLVNRDEIALADLPKTPQIAYLSDPFALRLLDGWWHDRFSRPPLIGMRANHGETCLEMVANGLGYAIFLSPHFLARSTDLFCRPLDYTDGRPFGRNSWMIWTPAFSNMPLVGNFLRYMQDDIAKGTASKPLPVVGPPPLSR
ncbi:LysR family transcriptional regulator [Siculibacillus lacustris]|uniref:LysR family transcriptional regulator n=1 Tax=Siculibacillus lacustris TaxID=1549641 RepID=UPI0013F17D17|nr:LysR family transcriptional regulator [Siculibacillus lacustris]